MAVIKRKVNIVVGSINGDSFLSIKKSKTNTQFKDKNDSISRRIADSRSFLPGRSLSAPENRENKGRETPNRE